METPSDINALLRGILHEARQQRESVLLPEDYEYFEKLAEAIHKGVGSIVIVQSEDGKLKYMFSNADRIEAADMLSKVLEAAIRKFREEGR